MNGAIILIIGLAILVCGYIFYGGWLAKQWGVQDTTKTPSHELEDGVDYCPAKAPVLMGHHFSSIAGAGPINGPIQAAVFGWVPVLLWVLIGGIFFGGVHDFGALFASVRHKGQSIGEVISTNIITAEVAAAQTNSHASVAMISILFIVLAVIFGFLVYRRNAPLGIASVIGVIAIVICLAIGLNFHPLMLTYTTWMLICGVYIAIASVTPVWILLQPRDYLSSFLLYGMMIIAVLGVLGSAIFSPQHGNMDIPAFTTGYSEVYGPLFPALFVTIACGAISGFHSLVSSGTTAKQLDNEKDAKPIAYGAMLIESALAIVSLCAVGYIWNQYSAGEITTPTTVFATGIAQMVGTIPGLTSEGVITTVSSLLVLAVSAFCLTSLDTATRLARYMFQEFWLAPGETEDNVTGYKKVLTNKYVSTLITVFLGIFLGLNGYEKIWGLFGAANQLLAALGLLAVAAWLGNVGKNNKMFLLPMAFMLVVTITSLVITIKSQFGLIAAGGADWGAYVKAILGLLLVVLAIILTIEGVKTLANRRRISRLPKLPYPSDAIIISKRDRPIPTGIGLFFLAELSSFLARISKHTIPARREPPHDPSYFHPHKPSVIKTVRCITCPCIRI